MCNPKGQTVGSSKQGLQMLPNALAANMSNIISCPLYAALGVGQARSRT